MNPSPAPMFSLELLGKPGWRTPAGRIGALSPQDAVLVALVALQGAQGRDVLAGQLWPQGSQMQAANNLRQHVRRLRRDTGHGIFDTGSMLTLLADVSVDANHVTALPPERLLDGEFLSGCDYGDNEFLHGWVGEKREALRLQRADALAGHAEALEKRGELAAAIRLAERIVEIAPLQEHAWRRLMRLHYLRGDHTAAVDAFERFERLLRDQTGARPGPETLRLLSTIERGSQAGAPPSAVVPVSLMRPPIRVGRGAEWRAMERAWAAARAFLLLGDAGIGKSRLLADLGQTRAGVIAERARPGDDQAPYSLLARVLRALIAHGTPAPEGFVRTELARLLPELGAAPQAPAQEGTLRRAVEALTLSAVEAGLSALLVDDLHFADVATLELLRWLSASGDLRAMRFGFAARPLDDSPVSTLLRSWLDDSQRPERIPVGPLSAAEVDQLLASLDLSEFMLPDLSGRLFNHAGGHPLFTLETLKDAWLHRRDLLAEALPRPQTVQTLIERRLNELPPLALQLAQIAAVSGIDFDVERAARLLDVQPLVLADALTALERANVLQELRFAHDLMQETALALVPRGLAMTLHANIAALLADDATVPPGRVATHWQAARRLAEAGAWWLRAGIAARMAGRLAEQQQLLERAATCFREVGDRNAEFNAIYNAFDGLQMRHGGAAVLAALPRLEALATGSEAVLKCRLVQAEALLDLERGAEALSVATLAVRGAGDWPLLLGDALCLQAMAYAQADRIGEAVVAAQHAADAANAAALPAQELRTLRSLAYVLFQAGRIGDSLPVQRRAARLAETLGDAAEGAAAEAAIAAILAASGDAQESHAVGRSADRRYRAMGLTETSGVAAVNLVVVGGAAAYLGKFTESIAALEAAQRMAARDGGVHTQAKCRIALALLHATLGDSAAARAQAGELPPGTVVGMRMQAALVLARADQLEGGSGREQLARLGRLGAEFPDVPLMQSAWIEWSYQGEARAALEKLAPLHEQFTVLGLPGTARTVRLRIVARLADLDDDASAAAAAAHAEELLPHVDCGMNAKTYPPEAWLILAHAFKRVRNTMRAAECIARGRLWVTSRALPNVPGQAREQFLTRNPINRAVLNEGI